ncbi:YIP1 family protein [Salinirubrum litoreum]|uniref:YIP1 family protein n=1 Tax=Salinirubrum litoreum TaxID=1126234 RepID=A0ABD5R8N7_9EURY
MTTWVENPSGGRDRGPRGLARAWVEVLLRPRRFFRNGVAPGDQAPGLSFAVAVSLVYVLGLFAFQPSYVPDLGGGTAVPFVLSVLAVALVIAPATLHLTAALQTILLIATVRDRAGVSETVQVIAYATAPAVVAGLPFPEVRILATLYGAALLVIGLATVHGTTLGRAAVAGAIPATLVFGYAFRGLTPLVAFVEGVLRSWYII